MDRNCSEATLVLIGHGSTVNADSAGAVYQHAAELRRRGLFCAVREGFWKQAPFLQEVVDACRSPRVYVAPLFISEGYFTDQAIPQALGITGEGVAGGAAMRLDGNRIVHYCRPVGTHPDMTRVVLNRAMSIVRDHPFPRSPAPAEITLFIAGHGTEQNANSRRAIEAQVAFIQAQNLYADVHGVFLEEAPRVESAYQRCRTKNMVMVPFFISDGMHSNEQIPVLLGESKKVVETRLRNGQATWRNPTERHGKRVWYSKSVGTDPLVTEIILKRVQEAGNE